MASVEFIQNRLNGAEDKLVKLEKKLERILKAEESDYEDNNPYYYTASDKKYTLRDIDDCKKSIQKYKEQLATEVEKNNSRNVQIIIDFLNGWRDKVYSMYEKAMNSYYEEANNVKELCNKYYPIQYTEEGKQIKKEYEEARLSLHRKVNGTYELKSYTNPWNGRQEKSRVKVEDGCWEFIRQYIDRGDRKDAFDKLSKDLEQEWKRKYDFIIERTNKIVGEIIDASDLRVTNGELNGIIIGNRGKAKVQTIGCGGWNIQVYHFRTRIDEVK